MQFGYSLTLTVDPSAKSRVKVSPAGTVKALITTVVQSLALDASSMELMVVVQSAPRLCRGAAKTRAERAKKWTARERIML